MRHPSPTRPPLAAVGLLSALLALAGCASDPARVLARVGNRTLTVDDFVDAAQDQERHYPGPPDTAKAMVLDDMVRATLVLVDAERLGLTKEPSVEAAKQKIESEEEQQALYRRLVPQDVPVSEAEVEQLYAWRDQAAHVRVIQCASRGAAYAAANQLAHGARFEDMADRYGIGGGPPGGDLGYLLPGALLPPLDDLMREAPLHTVLGPIESPGEGWFLMEVLARRNHRQKPLDEQRVVLFDMLRQRKIRAMRVKAQQALRDAYDIRLEPGGAQAMFAFFNQPSSDSTRGQLAPGDPRAKTVLGRYGSGAHAQVYTLDQALVDLTEYGRERPSASMLPTFEHWIDGQLLRRAALLEAKRRQLAQEPEVRRRIQKRLDSQVLDLYYDVEIAHGAEPGPDDLRAAYERSKDEYDVLHRVDVLVATLPDSATAAEVMNHGGHAPSLREAVAMAAPGARVTAETVPFPNAPPRWKAYQQVFMETAPHGLVGPVKTADGWRVAQVVSKDQAPEPLDQLPSGVVESLRQEALEISRDRLFDARVMKLRAEIKPQVYRERLHAVRWPAPSAPATPATNG